MAERRDLPPLPRADPLVVWALASFHTAGLTALLVVGLYLAGPLGDLLAGLDTLVGLGLYLALWVGTWWTTRRTLRAVADAGTDASAFVAVGAGAKWAGVNGALFFWVLLAGFAALNVPRESGALFEALPFLLVAGVVGSVLATGVGGIVGVLFAVLDLALVRAARRLVPPDDGERCRPDDGERCRSDDGA